jgi:chemotaxis protein methyltransferase CheR
MRGHCGVELSETQKYLMEPRLGPVAKAHGIISVDDLIQKACKPGALKVLQAALVDAMTTHESHFFRDTSFWKTIEEKVIPACLAVKNSRFRVLSTACSTGQEVYSLAMLLAEKWPELLPRLELVASDVAEGTLVKAKSGIYTSLEVNRGLIAPRLLKHFEKAEGGFRIKESFRKLITWMPHNLLEPLPGAGLYDIILCRNVLIYFGDADRRKVLAHLIKGLQPHGFIGLGAGELYLGSPLPGGFYERPKLPQERK